MNNPQDSSNEFPEIDLSKIVPWPPSVPFDETPWNWTVEGSLAQWVFALEDALNSTDEEYQLIVRSLAKIQIANILHDDRYSVQHRVFMARCIYFVTSLVPENELLALVRSAQISVIPRNGRLNRETGKVELVLPPIEDDHIVRWVGPYLTRMYCPKCHQYHTKTLWSRGELVDLLVEHESAHSPVYHALVLPCEECSKPAYDMTSADAEYLRGIPYDIYLQTDHWKETRQCALKRAGYRCQLCNAQGSLHVHHRTYERRGCEDLNDLTVLCASCHKTFHDNHKVVKD